MKKVYLAGGMKSGWQDALISSYGSEFIFIDPRTHGFTSEVEYTAWDLAAVDSCDILFACMEHDNPSGFGMMLEIGYARALGKKIIFVELGDDSRTRMYGMARQSSFFFTKDMALAIQHLRWGL